MKITILGAGLTGLTLGYLLGQEAVEFDIFEKGECNGPTYPPLGNPRWLMEPVNTSPAKEIWQPEIATTSPPFLMLAVRLSSHRSSDDSSIATGSLSRARLLPVR